MIRDATINDVSECVELMMTAAPEFNELLPEPEKLLWALFRENASLFSHEHVKVIEYKGKMAGMMLSYDYDTKKRESLRTGLLMIKHSGIKILSYAGRLLKMMSETCNIKKGDYYISIIAVYLGYREAGFGTELLKEAEKNHESLVLDVRADNHRAISLYERNGYEIVSRGSSYLMMKKVL